MDLRTTKFLLAIVFPFSDHFFLYISGSQQEVILSPRGHRALSGDILDYHNWEVVVGRYWHLEARDAKYSILHKTALQDLAVQM